MPSIAGPPRSGRASVGGPDFSDRRIGLDPPPLTPLFVGWCFRAKRCVLEPKKMRQGTFSIQPGYVHLQVDIKKPAKKQIGAVLFPEETINRV